MNDEDASEQFDQWLNYLPEFIHEFCNLMDWTSGECDFSPESLDVVEQWILDRYPNTESMLPPSEAQTANLLSCYVGETMIRRSGGHWALESDANDVFFGLPIVVLCDGDSDCPLSLVTAAADRRTGDYIRSVVCHD